MSNRCVTSFLDRGVSPYELWYVHRPTFDNILPFGTLGYMRRPQPEHELAPRGAKCIMLGLASDCPRDTFRVRDLTTDQVVHRQAITWHPPPETEETDTPPPRPKMPPHPTRTASRRDAMKQIQEKRRKARAAEATVTAATRLDEGGTPALGKTMGQVTSSRPAVVSSPSRANRSGKEAAIARAREKRKVAMAAAPVRRRLGSGGHDASDGMVGISDI